MKETVAFVYKWTELATLKWYIGSRAKAGCHPNDGYICSSKIVKPRIQQNPTGWVRTIVATGTPTDMKMLESELTTAADAMHDPRSYNMHNGDGKFTTLGKPVNVGIVRGPLSADHKTKLSNAKKGVPKPPFSQRHCEKIAQGKQHWARQIATPSGNFPSLGAAARALGAHKSTIFNHLSSPSYPDWYYLDPATAQPAHLRKVADANQRPIMTEFGPQDGVLAAVHNLKIPESTILSYIKSPRRTAWYFLDNKTKDTK